MHVKSVSDLLRAADCPQAFTPRTVTLPAAVPHVQVMLVVPCPAVMVAPVGTVQVLVTPVTAGVVKFTPTCEGHTEAGPVMFAGVAGKRVKAKVRVMLPAQLFTQATLNVPVVKVLGTLMVAVFKLLDAIVHPAGAVQL
jgi:hypothetical protein